MNRWNIANPVDLAWRKHFNIAFGSKAHLEADIFDQQLWWEEYLELEKMRKNSQERGVIESEDNTDEQTIILDEVGDGTMTEEEFDSIDLKDFKDA